MARVLLFFVLFFIFLTGWSSDFHRSINWVSHTQNIDFKDNSLPEFEGSIILDNTGIPYWYESFNLISASAEVTLCDTIFQPVTDAAIQLPGSIGSELQYKIEIGVSAGKAILRVTILPFIRRNSQIEKLTDFTISVQENRNVLKSAPLKYNWKLSSVLSSGKWAKIKTTEKGIFKISYDQLKQWGFSIPEQVSVYGNGGYMLPVMNKDLNMDDLNSYPVWKGKDNAGKDCLFFYSTGSIALKQNLATGNFSHQQNYYSNETFFYLTDHGNLNAINKVTELTEPSGKTVTTFLNYTFYEKETRTLIKSGSQWFGERFTSTGIQTININLDNPDLSKPAQFAISVLGRSSSSSAMNVLLNGKSVQDISFQSLDMSDPTIAYADYKLSEFSENLPSKNIQVKLSYSSSNSSAEAWLDYIGVNYQSSLNIASDVYQFRGKGADSQVAVSEYVVSGATSASKIFDITDIGNVFEVPAVYSNNQLKFKSNSAVVREYVAFNPGGSIPTPEWVGDVANQNLHVTDLSEMIIVTNSAFQSAANDLANFHRTFDQMSVQVITPEIIYNEFSGGLPDPSGMRNYFKMCYDKGTQSGQNTLKYILLLGDGSYDNRDILGKSHNLIPTYQSVNSLSPTESFVTDDFFVFLDENEGGSTGTVDLGIGRIPAFTIGEADTAVEKIINCDDEDDNIHMGQAESLATFVNSAYPAFYTDKIYLDAYKQISSSGGEKYPDVNVAINSRVKQGTLVMNYTGHANERALAAENVLDISAIDSWNNTNKLPIFVTATCEFSRFDGDETSAGEHILFNPIGGGVGLFSTTRLVYSGANFVLNAAFFKHIFEKDEHGNNLRLGDIMRLAKTDANTGTNQLNFSLLADPAMRLANPDYQVKTTEIDGKSVELVVDTIRNLSEVTVKGIITDNSGLKISNYNGEIIPTVYDKAMQVKTLGNSGEIPMSYSTQSNIIYRGLASVKNGEFTFSFFVPKDISFKLDKGKILYYAYNETADAHGYFNNFYIGGSSNATISDLNGPQIELFINSEKFKDGETVSANSVLLANITDETGINTSGIGIGHDITAILDDDNSNILVLNEYFQADKDSYTSGSIVFPLSKLSEGEHVLKLKVWDVLNNSSEKEIHFFVKDNFIIESVKCYPNPMQGETHFIFTHNQPDETFDVTLEVFQTSGARIDMLQAKLGSQGTESLPLEWIPAERNVKMKPGVYIYRLTVTSNGKKSDISGRLVFIYR